jgi:hypothetical protein
MDKHFTREIFGVKIDYKPLYDFSFGEEVFKLEILRCANFVGTPGTFEVVKIYIHRTKLHNYKPLIFTITAAARSKAQTASARSNIGIVGSNPTRGINVSL